MTGTISADEIHRLDGNDKLGGLPLRQLSNAQARRVIDYIQANLGCTLTLFDLANLVQFSPRQFFRIFSNTFGTTPHQYVMKERVARAKELISKGQLLVYVAADLGFANQSHFSAAFRKDTGMSPGRYRREHGRELEAGFHLETLAPEGIGTLSSEPLMPPHRARCAHPPSAACRRDIPSTIATTNPRRGRRLREDNRTDRVARDTRTTRSPIFKILPNKRTERSWHNPDKSIFE